jgi:hypothetical protein
MSWGHASTEAHPSASVLADYAHRRTSTPASAAVDLHVQSCMVCRYGVNQLAIDVEPDRVEHNLLVIAAAIEAPTPRLVERCLTRVGLSGETARLLAATPSLRRSWFIAIGLVLFFGLVAANPDRPNTSIVWFLALAPLLPVIGVAMAYGPSADPSYEMTLAAPISGFRLVLLRTVAVLAASIALTGGVALLMVQRQSAVMTAWFVPGLMLSALTLSLMTRVPPRLAAVGVAGTWIVLVIAISTRAVDEFALFRPGPQVMMAVVALAAAAVIVARRDAFDVATSDTMGEAT